MTVLIDNYDSFSYNLYQMAGELDEDIRVIRNDEMSMEEIENLQPDRIILSPGPGRPKDAGVCEEVILQLGERIPILGVCLGHQAICEAYGGRITYARGLMHGKQSEVSLSPESRLFVGLGEKTQVARYHSLAAEEAGLPRALRITARTADGEVMAVEHEHFPVYGVQFHPESILTLEGKRILQNFMAVRDSTKEAEHDQGSYRESDTKRRFIRRNDDGSDERNYGGKGY